MTAFVDIDDYVAIPRVGQLQLAPDGSRLIASVSGLSRDGKKYVSALWEIDPSGQAPPRRLTFSAAGESSPRFLEDGTVLFLSKRRADSDEESDKDVVGLWALPASGGEARRIASRPGGFDRAVTATASRTVILSA